MAQSILGANKDTYIDSYAPYHATNFGSFAWMSVGEYVSLEYPKALISFDISAISSEAIIVKAVLQLTTLRAETPGNTHYAYKLLHDDWVEGEVTFEIRSTGVTWTSGDFSASDYTVTNGVSAVVPDDHLDTITWDITAIVQDALDSAIKVNLVIILAGGETNYSQYFTKEWSTAGYRPKLTVDYVFSVGGLNPALSELVLGA